MDIFERRVVSRSVVSRDGESSSTITRRVVAPLVIVRAVEAPS